jgi:hypothetical protein
MKSPFKIPQQLNETQLHTELKTFLEKKFEKFYKENKDTIDDYLYFKSKLEEIENRLNFKYKITVYDSRNSGQIVNVKVKLPFALNKDDKSKYPFFNIHIGKLSNYKKGLEDEQLKKDVEVKIKEYIDSKYPLCIMNSNNQNLTFHY